MIFFSCIQLFGQATRLHIFFQQRCNYAMELCGCNHQCCAKNSDALRAFHSLVHYFVTRHAYRLLTNLCGNLSNFKFFLSPRKWASVVFSVHNRQARKIQHLVPFFVFYHQKSCQTLFLTLTCSRSSVYKEGTSEKHIISKETPFSNGELTFFQGTPNKGPSKLTFSGSWLGNDVSCEQRRSQVIGKDFRILSTYVD